MNITYYKQANVKFTTSSKGSRGRFVYADVKYINCLIELKGTTANIIYYNEFSNSIQYTTKKTTGKYFSFNGVECSKLSYDRILHNWEKIKLHTDTMKRLKQSFELKLQEKKHKENINKVLIVIKQKEERLKQIILEEQSKTNISLLNSKETSKVYQEIWNRLIGIVGYEYTHLISWKGIQQLITEHFKIETFFHVQTQ